MSELIDTTEMYLCTVYESLGEGVPPLRVWIAERLYQSGPTISQTVARIGRDSLLTVKADRAIKPTPKDARLIHGVVRKHRLAERLFIDVIGLKWEKVHAEACRWEYAISDEVRRRLLGILGPSTRSSYGNPIPGLKDLGLDHDHTPFQEGVMPLSGVALNRDEVIVTTERINENLQTGTEVLSTPAALGLRLGVEFMVRRVGIDLRFRLDDEAVMVDEVVTELLFVASY